MYPFFPNLSHPKIGTDIGNIGDEGKSKPISTEAEASVDSLMSKFNLGDSGGGGGFSDEKNDNQDTKIDDTMQSTQKSKND